MPSLAARILFAASVLFPLHLMLAQVPEFDAKLASAIETGDLAAVKSILATDPGLAVKPDDLGLTPLHFASENTAIATLLIEKGADINAKSQHFGTPLHRAIMSGNAELVSLLVARGADVNAIATGANFDGLNAMHFLTWVKDPVAAGKIFSVIVSKAPSLVDDPGKAGVTPLFFCVDRINPTVGALLISKGADPNKAPDGPESSAAAFLSERLSKEPELASELKPLAALIDTKTR